MANTAEGITVGDGPALDPNDPAAFEAIMASRGVQKEEGEESTPDRSIASGLTTAAGPEQAPAAPVPGRDDKGRFVSNQERAAATPGSDTAVTPATDTSGEEKPNGDFADPAVQEFLSKYDGNVEEALKGAANAQALIGRRDERTQEMERELAELKGLVQGLQAGRTAAPAAPALNDEQVADVAATRINSLGYEGAATEAANLAHTTGDERALATILEQWMVESPVAAMNFNTDFRLWQREQAAAAKAPEVPAWMQTAEEQVAVNNLTGVIESIAAERGVPKDSPIIEQMLPALEEMPKNVLDMVGSNDPEAVAGGVRLVMDRATLLAGVAASKTPEPTPAPSAAVARKLAGAAVASSALRPTPTAPNAPTNREDAIKEFKRQIVEAPTTSVASGLTYGPTP